MKKLIIFLPLIFAVIGCDKIKNPNQRPPQVYNCIDTIHQAIRTNTATSNFRKVLLEEYTGHHCTNCPRAVEAAEALEATYAASLVVIANHVNDFAKPNGNPEGLILREDFRNEASAKWDIAFGMANAGLPKGTINRTGGPNFPQEYSKWTNLIPPILQQKQTAKLDITSYYDTIKHYLSVNVKTTFKISLSNNVNLVLVLTQDSITGCQKDGDPPPGAEFSTEDPSYRSNFKFNNIAIGAINGTWGQLVKTAPIAVNDTVTLFNSCFLLDKCFVTKPYKVCVNDNYVHLVAFVYDVTTQEVLQVEKLRIK